VTRSPGPVLVSTALAAIVSGAIVSVGKTPRVASNARTSSGLLLRVASAIEPPPRPDPKPIEVRGHPSRTFRGSATRRNQSPFVGPADKPSATAIHELVGAIVVMPAILEGGDLLVASHGGALARLSPSGELRWKTDLGDRVYASPLVIGDRAFVGSDADQVFAVRLDDGRITWRISVGGDADTAPAEAPDGSIVAAAGTWLYVIRPSGSVRTRIRLPSKIFGSPAIAEDGTIYVGSQDDHLYAFSLAGARVFRQDLGADVDCAPLVGESGRIYVGTDGGHVFALEPSGVIRWRADVGGYVRGGLSLGADGSVLAGVYGPRPGVVALDPESGAERFAFRLREGGSRELGVLGGPLVDAAGRLYFGAADSKVYALDRTGKLVWAMPTSADVDAPVVLGPGGVLYAGTDDGRLYALQK
jgi:outer membrane protein assembly factor BamB